jgi:CheY-like chemotaxis protein/HPt (histidine-containing phosphotransfer) domain-containing protein
VIKDSAITKQKLSSLSDIDSDAIMSMTESQLLSYVQALNVTVSTYPLHKEELTYALQETDYASVFQWLKTICSSLSQMHADELAQECERFFLHNNDLNNIRPMRVKVFMDYFMPTLDLFFADVLQALEDLEVDVKDVEQRQYHIDPNEIRKKLLSIDELNADLINLMADEELCAYVQSLTTIHAEFQSQEHGLKNSIKIKHYVFVLQWLTALEESLLKLHATDLAEECRTHINIYKDFNNIRHEKLEVFIKYILSSVSMLSADIKKLRLPNRLIQAEAKSKVIEHIAFEVDLLSPGDSPDSKTILIINKMTMLMNSFKNALADKGHKLIGVTTAESAIGYLRTAKPDLFILDDDLHGTDSFMLIKIIRATGQQVPIIFTTSKITKEKMVKYMEAGVAEFIMKPFTPADVQKKVAKHLGG